MSQFENPATFGEPDLGAESHTWPKVVGIISIVWACLGLICNGCSAVSPLLQPLIMNAMPPEMQQQAQTQNIAVSVLLAVLGLVMSCLLLYAGLQTMRYSPKGRMLHLAWAIASVIFGLAGAVYGYGQMKQQMAMQMQHMQNDPNTAAQAKQMQPMMEMMGFLTFGCTMLLVMAWPIFILIWFGLVKRRPQDMGAPPQELVA